MFHRHDSFTFKDYKKTANGFLDISGIVTRNGIFKYDDGNELRPYDEVFKESSLQTMFAIPTTWKHPVELLKEETISLYQKGFVASKPVIEKLDDNISVVKLDNIIIQDKGLIHEIIENGLREFSLGYTCDLEEKVGTFDGQDYVRIQKNIVYNHLALVDDARCGKVCSIVPKLDSKEVKLDCNCQKERADMKEEDKPKEEKKVEDNKKDEGGMPEWATKMFEQHEKMISLLEGMSSKKEDEDKDKPKEDPEDKPKNKEDKRKDSISNFKFVESGFNKIDENFEPYTRESFLKKVQGK